MDVAAFLGFASAGPLDSPVAVESVAEFTDVFGEDLPLAWDGERGEFVRAYLGPAVRDFFRNGGRRCWVVRVAGADAAANTFRVPGLYARSGGGLVPAYAQARSEGSWSDSVQVAAALASRGVAAQPGPLERGTDAVWRIRFTGGARGEPAPSDLLRFRFAAERVAAMAAIAALDAEGAALVAELDAPLWSTVEGMDDPASWSATPPGTLPVSVPAVERLTFDLLARRGLAAPLRLRDLGFAPGHPRYWRGLPTDEELWRDPSLWPEATRPRFPLAPQGSDDPRYVPVGMAALPGEYAAAEIPPGRALERDGLAAFGAALFLDPTLRRSSLNDLAADADFIRYQAPSPRALTGIHALFYNEEVTIIAAPDAVHRGWRPAELRTLASPPDSEPLARPEWWRFLPCQPPPKIERVTEPQWGEFLRCDLVVVEAPELSGGMPDPQGSFTLSWTAVPGAVYLLEEAGRDDFAGAQVVYRGGDTSFTLLGRGQGEYFYRVRAEIGKASSDWSNGVAVLVERQTGYELAGAGEYAATALLDVQRSLLRMAAARGDMLAVLDMPEHYREDAALAHAAALKIRPERELPAERGSVAPIGWAETSAFSYGALYHPWIFTRDAEAAAALASRPPSGAACGILARRALARGAWIAPANETLAGAIALTPPIAPGRRLDFQDAQINLLRHEPRGFLALCADTLSEESDVRPINVRRLMSLLRRLALQLGATYVFEPNGEEFRRLVDRAFEVRLGRLFELGAFAGNTASQSFQVVTGEPLNNQRTRERGQFFVELRVAPAQPLTFLTIRLVQTGDRTLVTEVR
jgi:hypothetical protein